MNLSRTCLFITLGFFGACDSSTPPPPAKAETASPAENVPPGRPATLKEAAQQCASSLVNGDYATFVGYCHPRLLKGMGGADRMIASIRGGLGDGASLIKAEIGEPGPVQDLGTWKVSLVPQTLFIKVSGGKLKAESTLLAISEDGGGSWTFMDSTPYHHPQFADNFPELAGKLDVPPKRQSVFERDS